MMLLSHSNHFHEQPQKTIKPSPKSNQEINDLGVQIEEKLEPSTMTIQVRSSAPISSNLLPGLGEFMFVMVVMTPIVLTSIKTRINK